MSRSVYVASPEGLTGKSAVALGLLDALIREVGSVGVFRPLTTLGTGYVREAHERFEAMQEQIHGGEAPPSERVMVEHDDMFGREYRVQSEGEHPDPAMREK